jgi:hypothetical protein
MEAEKPEQRWMSLRAYARHRGVALSAVQKAIDSGRVTAVRRNAAGRLKGIEAIAADAQWLANTDPVESARTTDTLRPAPGPALNVAPAGELPLGRPGEASGEDPAPPAGGAAASADAGKDFGYLEARAKREGFQAKQAELDYLQAIGELVPTAELRSTASRRYRSIRDKLLGIADRQCALLAAEKDPARVHAALTKEIKQVLHELSDDARAEAARGAAERVAA